jgi:CheY-like chemotaxis protein
MVIVADDDEPMRATLIEAIGEAFSVRVVGAENGQRVLDLVRGARPDAIVLDVQMPVLGGLDTARRLKADPAAAGIPLLAISGEAARAEALASGFADSTFARCSRRWARRWSTRPERRRRALDRSAPRWARADWLSRGGGQRPRSLPPPSPTATRGPQRAVPPTPPRHRPTPRERRWRRRSARSTDSAILRLPGGLVGFSLVSASRTNGLPSRRGRS